MGLISRNIHGKDFLVYLLEKEQLYIGPKGEYDKGKIEIVRRAIKHNDQKMDNVLQKYIEDMKELSNYLPQPERKEFLSKRTAELVGMLRRLEEERLQQMKMGLVTKLTNPILNQIRNRVAHYGLPLKQKQSIDEMLKELDEELKNDKS